MDRRKIYLAGIIVLAVLALVSGWFLLARQKGNYRAIPGSALAVIEVNDWRRFTEKLGATVTGSDLRQTGAWFKLDAELTCMANLLSADASLTGVVTSGNTIASVHLTSAEDFDFLFTTQLKGINDNALLNRIQRAGFVKSVKIRIFKKQKLIDLVLADGRQMTFASLKGFFVFSSTSFLTEASVSALLTGESVENDATFITSSRKVERGGDARVYFNFSMAGVLLPVMVQVQQLALFDDLQQYADWAAFKVTFDNDGIKCSGASVVKGNPASGAEQAPLLPLLKVIPGNAAVVNISAVDTTTFGKNETLSRYFNSWTGDSKAFVTLESPVEDFIDQNLFIAQVNDEQKAIAALNSLAALDGSVTTPVDTYANINIYYLPNGEVINQVFGSSFARFGKMWFALNNGYAIFGNDLGVLELSLEKIKQGDVLARNEAIVKLAEGRQQFTYVDPQRAKLIMRALLKKGSTEGFLKNFSGITAVSKNDDDIKRIEVIMNSGSVAQSTGLLWKTKLKAMATYAPQVLLNPGTGAHEIFIQDTATNIYLLNSSGQIIFTRNLGEAVIGEVYQMDYYNNGNVQYIFNSPGHLFIVDRKGEDVASYPLRFSYPATAGVTVVSDTVLNSYRYFVPCSNGAIYGYMGNGRPLPGWSPKTGAGRIDNALLYFKGVKKEHIAAFTTGGKLTLYSIKGEPEWVAENIGGQTMPEMLRLHADFKFLSAAGTEMTEVGWDGNKKTQALIDSAYYFTATTLNDTDYNYYFANSTQVRCYGADHQFKASTAVKDVITGLRVIMAGGEKYLLIAGRDKIHLFDIALKPLFDFENPGSKSFNITDLFDRGELVSLTVDRNGNCCCTRLK